MFLLISQHFLFITPLYLYIRIYIKIPTNSTGQILIDVVVNFNLYICTIQIFIQQKTNTKKRKLEIYLIYHMRIYNFKTQTDLCITVFLLFFFSCVCVSSLFLSFCCTQAKQDVLSVFFFFFFFFCMISIPHIENPESLKKYTYIGMTFFSFFLQLILSFVPFFSFDKKNVCFG